MTCCFLKRRLGFDETLVNILNAENAQSRVWNVMPFRMKDLLIFPCFWRWGGQDFFSCINTWGLISFLGLALLHLFKTPKLSFTIAIHPCGPEQITGIFDKPQGILAKANKPGGFPEWICFKMIEKIIFSPLSKKEMSLIIRASKVALFTNLLKREPVLVMPAKARIQVFKFCIEIPGCPPTRAWRRDRLFYWSLIRRS